MILLPIPNAPGYFAGDDGNVYSNLGRGKSKKSREISKLSPGIQSTGRYYVVSIRKDGIRKTHRVHRLICEAFHGSIPFNNSTVSHLDGDWKNNKPENLKWESYSDNHQRKKSHGTDDIGYKNSRAKVNKEQLEEIRVLLAKGYTHQSIADQFNVNRVFITKINRGHRYKNQ